MATEFVVFNRPLEITPRHADLNSPRAIRPGYLSAYHQRVPCGLRLAMLRGYDDSQDSHLENDLFVT